mmetsp:Transcript_8951/g.18517  ORF Transcript_8951/g.18517 Transcript_8951/m.18517 type:complete len:238 (-) Transcript_8951:501-1214(-)
MRACEDRGPRLTSQPHNFALRLHAPQAITVWQPHNIQALELAIYSRSKVPEFSVIMWPDGAVPGKRQPRCVGLQQLVVKVRRVFVGEAHICRSNHRARTLSHVNQGACMDLPYRRCHDIVGKLLKDVLHKVRIPSVDDDDVGGAEQIKKSQTLSALAVGSGFRHSLRRGVVHLDIEDVPFQAVPRETVPQTDVMDTLEVEAKATEIARLLGAEIHTPSAVKQVTEEWAHQVNTRCHV